MDALRGGASIYVALFHFNEIIPYQSNYWQTFCKQGWLGVPVFFVISGWCMAMIIPREKSPFAFLAKRLMRIYPPYWFSLVIVMGVIIWRVTSTGTNDVTVLPKSALAQLATLTLLTSPASPVSAINWVYWSLTYEVAFYVLIYFGLVLRRPTLFLVALLFLSLLVPFHFQNYFLGKLLFFTDQFPLFLLGFLGYDLPWNARAIGLVVLSAAIGFFSVHWLPTAVALLTLMLLLGSEMGSKAMTNWLHPLAKVGDWSYSLYLIHVPIGCYVLVRFRTERILQSNFLHMSYDLGALAVCLIFAWLMHITVEKPSHQFAQRLARRLK